MIPPYITLYTSITQQSTESKSIVAIQNKISYNEKGQRHIPNDNEMEDSNEKKIEKNMETI